MSLEWERSVAVIRIDDPDHKMNTLKAAMIAEFDDILNRLDKSPDCKAVVVISGKPDCFIAGADVTMFADLTAPGSAEKLSREGHRLMDRLEQFPKPVIAAIRGPALGGGLEVALACHYRMAAEDGITVLGLPEVKLGLLPGSGGTQRLPRLVGLQAALGILLTGSNVYPRKAYKLGLVDQLVQPYALLDAAVTFALKMAKKPRRKPRRRSILNFLLESNPLGRRLVLGQARKKVLAETAGNYPAPLKILKTVAAGFGSGGKKGFDVEARCFDELVRSPESRALVQLFFGMQEARKNPNQDKARPVSRLGILGAGLMGAGIAEVSVEKGIATVLKDRDEQSLARGEKQIWSALNKKASKRIISRFQRDRYFHQVMGCLDFAPLGGCDLVIEAVFEDLTLKRDMLALVEKHGPEHCIFASNTSSLPIGQIAQLAARPEQVIGMHYFSPVPKMPLLEIVVTDQTADWVVATAVALGIRQGKNIIVVGDGPGFYTTRILAPMMNEALHLLSEGARIEDLDRAMIAFGFPVGPVTLIDEVGIDVGAHVAEIMADLMSQRGVEPNPVIAKIHEDGYGGRKNKKGFYRYESGSKKSVNTSIYKYFGGPDRKPFKTGEIQERLSLAMVNEAVWCLQDDVLKSPRDGDLGAILGLGFPPFRGGPFRYLDAVGSSQTFTKLQDLAAKHGPRFKPAGLLEDYSDKPFYKTS